MSASQVQALKYNRKDHNRNFFNRLETISPDLSWLWLITSLVVFTIVVFSIYIFQIESWKKTKVREASYLNEISFVRLKKDIDHSIDDLNFLSRYSSILSSSKTPSLDDIEKITLDFAAFGKGSNEYDHIRIIDNNGNETVRVDFDSGRVSVKSKEQLQNKLSRSYVREGLKLQAGKVFVSPLDLNIENGIIEEPIKPVLRLVAPLFNQKSEKIGILVLNSIGLTRDDEAFSDEAEDQLWSGLANDSGYWLVPPEGEKAWGFMYGHEPGFASGYASVWSEIRSTKKNLFTHKNRSVVVKRFHQESDLKSKEIVKLLNDKNWYIIRGIKKSALLEKKKETLALLSIISLPALLLIFFLNHSLASNVRAKKSKMKMLSHALKLRNILSACNRSLLHGNNKTEYLQAVCQSLVREGGYPLVWIGKTHTADAAFIEIETAFGPLQKYLDDFDDEYRGRFIAGDAIRKKISISKKHVAGSDENSWETIAFGYGIRRSIAIPLIDERINEKYVLRIYSEEEADFFHDEQQLFEELSHDIIFGLHSFDVKSDLEEKTAQFMSLSEESMVGVYMVKNDKFVYVNPRLAEIFSHGEASELIGKPVFDLVAPEDADRVRINLKKRYEGATKALHYEFLGVSKFGARINVEVYGCATTHAGDPAVIGTLLDVTQRTKNREELHLFKRAIEASNEGIAISNNLLPDKPFIYINPAFEKITGYEESEVLGENGRFLLGREKNQPDLDILVNALRNKKATQVQLRNYKKDGSFFWNQLSVAPVKNSDGETSHFVSIFQDVSERKEYISQLRHLTNFDPLTNLANKNLFSDRLEQALLFNTRRNRNVGLLALDLRKFKSLLHSIGEDNADEVILVTAERLVNEVRKHDTVARLGNDQFAIVLQDISDESDIISICQNLQRAVSAPIHIGQEEFSVSSYVGVAVAPRDGEDSGTLLRSAQAAAMKAIDTKDGFEFFAPQMSEEAGNRIKLEASLRKAIDRQELQVYYQPKISLVDGSVIGAEALVRWIHPEMGMIMPDKFIPIAEETGLIIDIGEFVLKESCRFIKQLNTRLGIDLSIAVNFSALQFKDSNLMDRIEEALSESGIDPVLLEVELTESIIMSNPDVAIHSLNEIRRRNISIALDDFGTGYSSLSYLRKFPIDVLKIDRSFIKDLPYNNDDILICKAVIALAKSLGLIVVAEGVETEAQNKFLKEQRCDQVQGYMYSKPISDALFEDYVKKHLR